MTSLPGSRTATLAGPEPLKGNKPPKEPPARWTGFDWVAVAPFLLEQGFRLWTVADLPHNAHLTFTDDVGMRLPDHPVNLFVRLD